LPIPVVCGRTSTSRPSALSTGAEDEATRQLLRAVGCDLAQGYHLSRPMPVQQLEAWHDDARGAVRG
jgi:EAL domain-containing protein (putative c-di-GMP-specific phosphodiesterase class I)